jgi:hypothetical protein
LCQRVFPQKVTNDRDDLFRCIFKDIVATIGKTVNFGVRKTCLPFPQKKLIKNEVLVPPENTDRDLGKLAQTLLNLANQRVAGVFRL